MDYSEAIAHAPVVANEVAERAALVRGVSLCDAILLLVGGTIGSGLFLTSSSVAGATKTPILFLLAWIVGMGVTALASVSMAELGAMFPEAGGQYVFLREAFGEYSAFLYGWMIFAINATGSLAAIAAGFAAYSGAIIPGVNPAKVLLTVQGWNLNLGHLIAIAAIVFLTVINIVGLRPAVILQNLATWAKFAAIAAFLVLGFAFGHGSWSHYSAPAEHYLSKSLISGFGVALIAVFWVYDGWVYITWVAGEVKRPERNIPRALILSCLIIGAIVILMNALYLYAMPLAEMSGQLTVAESAARTLFSSGAARFMAALVGISCFGAAANVVMSGARVYFAMAKDGVFFARLAEVHSRWRTPVFSLVVQCVWSCILVLSGRYDQLFTYVMFVGVLSYGASTAAIFVLRRKLPNVHRGYACPGYPWVPLLYCVICAAWALNTLRERPLESLAGTAIMLAGTPAYLCWRRRKERQQGAA